MSDENLHQQIAFLLDELKMRDFVFDPSSKRFTDTWELIWRDLVTKTDSLEANKKVPFLISGLIRRLRAEKILDDGELDRIDRYYSAIGSLRLDVLVFTVLEVEWSACIEAFGELEEVSEIGDLPFAKLRVFRVSVPNYPSRYIGVTLVGRAHNTDCAVFCGRVFETLCPKYAFLVGISAVRQDKLKLGDVVSAYQVLEIDRGRILDEGKELPTTRPFDLTENARREFGTLREPSFQNSEIEQQALRSMLKSYSYDQSLVSDQMFKLKKGIIVSGNYVRRDGILNVLSKTLNDDILALEMEGAGFALTSETHGVDWFVFRGGSDFGDRMKSDQFQPIAAFNAAKMAKVLALKVLENDARSASTVLAPIF